MAVRNGKCSVTVKACFEGNAREETLENLESVIVIGMENEKSTTMAVGNMSIISATEAMVDICSKLPNGIIHIRTALAIHEASESVGCKNELITSLISSVVRDMMKKGIPHDKTTEPSADTSEPSANTPEPSVAGMRQ